MEILQLTQQVNLLQVQVSGYEAKLKKKDDQIKELEKRLDVAEQYYRLDDLIISGLKTRHRAYSNVAAGNNVDDTTAETETLESQVIQFFGSKDIPIHRNQISACRTLPRNNKNSSTSPAIIIRFVNRKDKVGLLQQGFKLKGTEVFVNEHLTRKNGNIAYAAQQLKKAKKIKATWTWNCKVYIRTNGATPEDERVLMVKEMDDLNLYK
ncbi:zinc finger protein 397-like [Labeo rohita]|uniref:Zinc finger protein 397-like n=1 Tax=Labeo rohita TaxID=84645 RepID=A0A498NMI5_LABRO|nr:zinc finger protein 397-like [Labeo rohita]